MRFAVTTFQRVFDTNPNRDVLGLERLIYGLTHFLVKPKATAQVQKELERLERAEKAFRQGSYESGRYWGRLTKAKHGAEAMGTDPREATEKELAHLRKEILGGPKKDLRLWSPTHYPPDSRRGGENVLHISCLVLDYDSGISIEDAAERWHEYFHIVHTTWSHTDDTAKFRLTLPLAQPVRKNDWPAVYAWAEERADFKIDPSNKGAGTTFALPAVADPEAPRRAFSSPGPLLDIRLEGLIDEPAELPEPDVSPDEPNHFRIPIPGHTLVEGSHGGDSDDIWHEPSFPWS